MRIILFSLLIGTAIAQPRAGFLHGTVLDANGAAVPGVHIEVAAPEGRCSTQSNAEGRFDCRLAGGIYVLTAESFNSLPYKRAPIRIRPSAHRFVFIRPVWHAPTDQKSIHDPEVRFKAEMIAPDMTVMLQFESLREQEGESVFSGRFTMLTFDDIAIYGSKIVCSKPIRSCAAGGGITVQVGNEQFMATDVEIDFPSRKLVISREPQVVRVF